MSKIKNNSQVVGEITLAEYIDLIKNSSPEVTDYRKELGLNPQKAASLKKAMQAITPCGTHTGKIRENESHSVYSGMVNPDIDQKHNMGVDMHQVKSLLTEDRFVSVVHYSVSGKGLAVFIKVDSGPKMHASAYEQVAEYISQKYGVIVDPSCKDLARQRYLSFDPEIHYNPQSEVFHILPDEDYKLLKSVNQYTSNKTQFIEGNRNNYIHQFSCNANRKGIKHDVALSYVQTYFQSTGITKDEIIHTVDSGYSHIDEHGDSEVSEDSEAFAAPRFSMEQFADTPCFEDHIFDDLPDIFKFIIDIAEDKRERDIMLAGFIGVLSAIFPNVSGIHSGKRVFPNIYLGVYAPSGAGKGKLGVPKDVGSAVHELLKEECQSQKKAHRQACAACKQDINCIEMPEEPACRSLYIKGDISTSALKDFLNVSDMNIIFEMESYVLSKNAGKDWANSEDVFLNGWEHEPIGKSRVDDEKDVEVNDSKLSLVVSGTPSMLERLIPSVDSGFFSRTFFYVFTQDLSWKDQFSDRQDTTPAKIEAAKAMLLKIFQFNRNNPPVEIRLTVDQRRMHNEIYAKWTEDLKKSGIDREYFASIARSGRVFFRIIMILSAIRRAEEQNTNAVYTCHDLDFEIARSLCTTFYEHSKRVFLFLSTIKKRVTAFDDKSQILKSLPDKFLRKDAVSLGEARNISDRAIDDWLKAWQSEGKIIRKGQGKYEVAKPSKSSETSN